MAAPDVDVFLRHAGFVRGVAQALLRDENDVADAVQDTWVATLGNRPAPDRPERPWLAAVVRNAARRLLRGRRRRQQRERRASRPERVSLSAGDQTEHEETLRAVVEAVLALREPYRRTVILHYYEGCSYAEIAERCGIAVETVRSRLKRARARLRADLGRHAGGRYGALATTGGLLMGIKTKLALGLAVLAFVAVLVARRHSGRAGDAEPRADRSRTDLQESAPVQPVPSEERARKEPEATSPSPANGAKPSNEQRLVRGRLRYSDGTPVGNKQVGQAFLPAVSTDENGSFRLERRVLGVQDFCIHGPHGFLIPVAQIRGDAADAEIVIERGVTLAGAVRYEDTRVPVAGALLSLRRPSAAADKTVQAKWVRGKTGPRGRFSFEHLLSGRYELTLTARKVEPLFMDVQVDPAGRPAEFFVRRARDLVVVLAGSRKAAPQNVTVGVWGLDGSRLRLMYMDKPVGGNGEIRVEAPPPGRYGINVLPATGAGPAQRAAYQQGRFESVPGAPVRIVLARKTGARVEGTIRLPDGKPAVRRLVKLENGGVKAFTDAEGRFVFESAPEGDGAIVLRVGSADRWVGTVSVPATGVVRRDILVTGTGSIRGRFTSAVDAVNPLLFVSGNPGSKHVARYFFPLGGKGDFRIPLLPPGTYVVTAYVPRKGRVVRNVTVGTGPVDLGAFGIAETPKVPFVVAAPEGVRLAGEHQVRATGADGSAEFGALLLDDEGRGHLQGLPPGTYEASVKIPGCAPAEFDVEVAEGATTVELDLARR